MNAFGKRNGLGSGQRPQFGVARPMKAGPGSAPSKSAPEEPGGEQFPPIDDLDAASETSPPESPNGAPMGEVSTIGCGIRAARWCSCNTT